MIIELRSYLNKLSGSNPLISAFVSIINDSSGYLIGGVMIGLGNIILVPIFTRTLTPSEFGAYTLIEISILIIVTITQLGLGVSYLKWYADIGEERRSELLTSTLVIGFVSAAIGSIFLLFILVSPIGTQVINDNNRGLIWILIPIIILENLIGLMLSDLRARRLPLAFSISMIFRLFVIIFASILFIVVFEQGIFGVFLGKLIGDIAGFSILAILCLSRLTISVNISLSKNMIRYGMPLVWSSLMAMMLDASGRFFIESFGSIEQVGYYALAVKITGIFQMLIYVPFGAAWGGLLFQIAKWEKAQLIFSKILSYLLIFSLGVAFILIVLSPSIFRILSTEAFFPSLILFPIVIIARAIAILEYPTSVGLYIRERTKISPIIYSFGLILNIIGNYLLFPKYGILGTGLAWCLSWILIVILMASMSQLFYKLIFNWKIILGSILFLVVLISNYETFVSALTELSLLFQFLLAIAISIFVFLILLQDFRIAKIDLKESEVKV